MKTDDPGRASSEAAAEIRQIIERRATAVRAGDADAILRDLADDAVIFDVVGPLRHAGKADTRKRIVEWLGSYDDPPTWENRDVHVVASGPVAFSHALSRVTGRLKTGANVDMWFRTTLGIERRAGSWLIVHDHGSDPFDAKSGKASRDLKP